MDVQLEKLNHVGCQRIYQEKRSGRTSNRPEFQSCMNYLREGDTLVITRLDRLARSVVHLAQLAKRFEQEKINLIVIDQNIDTSTSTGRLMFNMLASIAEFENDLRTERQAEGIAKAKENGVKFGRPAKLNEQICHAIHLPLQRNGSREISMKETQVNESPLAASPAGLRRLLSQLLIVSILTPIVAANSA
ncbi:TPA: recombinase family protein [Vibrio parahaemolyticus]